MHDPVRIAQVAIGGYGGFYLKAILDQTDPSAFVFEGIVDPLAERCPRLQELRDRGIPIYDDLDAFYARHSAELVIIASPIHWHLPHTLTALQHGSNVLCEKPLGATIQDANAMIAARDDADRFVAIGYQWSFASAIRALKRDILNGDFGRPRRAKCIALWPRDRAYYHRNSWAGCLKTDDGRWILDSPVNNATAHYLHNLLYLLGPAADRSATPLTVQAELYRANPITNYDTGILRAGIEGGAEVLFCATHAVKTQRGPEFALEFEQGTVTFGGEVTTIQATMGDGTTRDYGNPNRDHTQKLRDCMAAVRGSATIACGPEAASAQTLVMNGMYESAGAIRAFPEGVVEVHDDGKRHLTAVNGLEATLGECYERFCLPAEIGARWAVPGEAFPLAGYDHFPDRWSE